MYIYYYTVVVSVVVVGILYPQGDKKKSCVIPLKCQGYPAKYIRVKRLDYCIRGKTFTYTSSVRGMKNYHCQMCICVCWSRVIFMLGTFFSWTKAKVQETHKTR